MSELRKITVHKNNPEWQEYDGEVLIELWHDAYRVTELDISLQEARYLLALLTHFLGAQGSAK